MNENIKSASACALMAKKVAQEKKILSKRNNKVKLSPKKLKSVSKLSLNNATSINKSSKKTTNGKSKSKENRRRSYDEDVPVGNSKKRLYPFKSSSAVVVGAKKRRKIEETEDESILDESSVNYNNDEEEDEEEEDEEEEIEEGAIEEIKTTKKRVYIKSSSKWSMNNNVYKNGHSVPNTSDFVNYMVSFRNPVHGNEQKMKLYSKLIDNVKITNKNPSAAKIDFNSKLNLYTRNTVNYNNLSIFNKYIDKDLIGKVKNKNFNSKIDQLNYLNCADEHYSFLLTKWNHLKDKENVINKSF